MIVIGKPQIISVGEDVRLQTTFRVDHKEEKVWFQVGKKYRDYLCQERCDAFVVGVLNYAMRYGHDIKCEAPIGEYLYYQISVYLIEALCKSSKGLYKTQIQADIDFSVLETAGAVGTGISCGVDSFHVLAMQSDSLFKKHNITHLAFNNVGSHGRGENARKLYTERKLLAEKFCQENGFELVESDSNLMDVIPQNHLLSHTYSSCFAILALQKLYSIYYYASSGYPFQYFSLQDNEKYDCAYYELLSLDVFSTPELKIYSEGGALSRFDKIKRVAEYTPSYKYLNVCIKEGQNCGQCEKCTRTLLALDALGKLDLYRNVFDIDYYRLHRREYLVKLYGQKWCGNTVYKELYPYFKKKVTVGMKVIAWIKFLKVYIAAHLKEGNVKDFLRRINHSALN